MLQNLGPPLALIFDSGHVDINQCEDMCLFVEAGAPTNQWMPLFPVEVNAKVFVHQEL